MTPVIAGRLLPNAYSSVGRTSLDSGLVFAWATRAGAPLDLFGGKIGVPTGVTQGANGAIPRTAFAGGGDLASVISFGTNSLTAGLGIAPATWAVYGTWSSVTTSYNPLCHCDNNVANGWQISTVASTGGQGLTLIRSTTDLRVSIQLSSFTNSNVPFSFVVTHDGSNTAANCKIYVNGTEIISRQTNTDGSGTSAAASAESLYLGRGRSLGTGAQSHQGDLYVALIAARQWSSAEVAAFAKNPFAVFGRERRVQTGPFVPSTGGGNSLFFGSTP